MCVQITIEDAQAQQWISEIHPDVQLVSNMDSISFFVRVCVCVFYLTLISRWLLRNMGTCLSKVRETSTILQYPGCQRLFKRGFGLFSARGFGLRPKICWPPKSMHPGTQGRVIRSINSNKE